MTYKLMKLFTATQHLQYEQVNNKLIYCKTATLSE